MKHFLKVQQWAISVLSTRIDQNSQFSVHLCQQISISPAEDERVANQQIYSVLFFSFFFSEWVSSPNKYSCITSENSRKRINWNRETKKLDFHFKLTYKIKKYKEETFQ